MFSICFAAFALLLAAPQSAQGVRVCVRWRSNTICYNRSPVEDLICHKGGKHHEGDMILTDEQKMALMTSEYNASDYRWPNATVSVQLNGTFSSNQTSAIWEAMNSIESVSCVRFVNQTDESNFVQIMSEDDGCYTEVGYQEKVQTMNLGSKCFQERTIPHLLLHVLGFVHAHSTSSADPDSIMHCNYDEPHGPGSNSTLSDGDIQRINGVYECN